ncbi:uncharacterized protein VP01_4440g3 [Puccinia sorghi]|uniref:Xrn1 helical domain-containing protein n=1 Tax=Puccinia sorghi TaxID=27349 RepID=A0A0L6UQB2_9BASI|nr:uncharacterized protein VP01_4440g3 [Puccinia sorghi]
MRSRGAIGFVSSSVTLEEYLSGYGSKLLRYLDPELNLCICFDKVNKNNEPLILLDFDLDQLPSQNPAINSLQYILEDFQLEDTSKLRGLYTYAYKEALKWVWNYYYDGFTSWIWFYPYFYSPMISGSTSSPNLINFVKLNFSFNLSNPFKPFDKIVEFWPP